MRIAGADTSGFSGALAAYFQEQAKQYGRTLPSSEILARRPTILLGHIAMSEGLEASGLLPASLKALVNRRVAAHNGCPF